MVFSEATTAIGEIITQDSRKGSVLLSWQLEPLRQLSSAIEAFVDRTDRRELVPRELSELNNIRMIRFMEDRIAEGEFPRVPDADHTGKRLVITEEQEKEERIKEERAKEEREKEEMMVEKRGHPTPTLEEAQRDIFKVSMPENGKPTGPGSDSA